MDTRKALSAIIILLILMNITLGIYLIVINSGRGNMEDTLSYTRTILNERNYKVDCYIPEKAVSLSSVILGENRFTEQSLESVMEKTGGNAYIEEGTGIMYFQGSATGNSETGDQSRTATEAIAGSFIESIGINRDEFILDSFKETGASSYMLRYIAVDEKGMMYFGSFIEMVIADGSLQTSRILYPVSEAVQVDQSEGMPVHTILLASLKATGVEKTIESINPGYFSTDSEAGTVSICWRVRFSDGEERFFDAATGMEID